MTDYLITYDFEDSKSSKYRTMNKAINGISKKTDIIKILETTWLLTTNLSSKEIYEKIEHIIDGENDTVFIAELGEDYILLKDGKKHEPE